jgi:hypothetical protein
MGVYENSFPAASFEDIANNDMFVNGMMETSLHCYKWLTILPVHGCSKVDLCADLISIESRCSDVYLIVGFRNVCATEVSCYLYIMCFRNLSLEWVIF